MKNSRGFTLVEFLIAATIISFIGGVLYSTLSQGLNVWNRANQADPELDIEIFFEKAEKDLRNAFYYSQKPFQGNRDSLEFVALLKQHPGAGGSQLHKSAPAAIRYSYNSKYRQIEREVVQYQQILSPDKDKIAVNTPLKNVVDYHVVYYDPGRSGESPGWRGRWVNHCFPSAVKMTVQTQGKKKVSISRIIDIPTKDCKGDDS